MNTPSRILGLTALAAASTPLVANASETLENIESRIEKTWSYADLYENKENSFIQKVAFTGRLQYDYSYFDNKETTYQDENKWRRARAGFKIDFLNDFQLHTEMDMDLNDHDPVYNRLTDTYIAWKPNSDLKIKVGKQSAGFTLDGATSSKKLWRLERSLIASNIWFGTEYFTGITAAGTHENWSWKGGLFSTDGTEEFDKTFDVSYFTLASVGYNFADSLEVDNALLRFDYVYQDEADEEDYADDLVGTRDHEHVLSLSFQYDNGNKHLHTDLAFADSFDGNDTLGLQIMPFYDLSDYFQVVGSYTYMSSDDNTLSVGRYAMDLATGKTDEINELFLGFNTFFYGHKVKWQNGIKYTTTGDDEYDGLGFTSGIRISW